MQQCACELPGQHPGLATTANSVHQHMQEPAEVEQQAAQALVPPGALVPSSIVCSGERAVLAAGGGQRLAWPALLPWPWPWLADGLGGGGLLALLQRQYAGPAGWQVPDWQRVPGQAPPVPHHDSGPPQTLPAARTCTAAGCSKGWCPCQQVHTQLTQSWGQCGVAGVWPGYMYVQGSCWFIR